MSMIVEKARGSDQRLTLDYPRQGELIDGPFYTVRVSAPEIVNQVEVSVDGGDWQACRKAVGHWWFDWSGFMDGDHEISARVVTPSGRLVTCTPHVVRVQQNKTALYN